MIHQKGLHHITAFSGDGQRNAEFYVYDLGLRLVLKSVNQDDPSIHHLFYANGSGAPGSSMTFFPIPRATECRPGVGETNQVSFSVPEESFDYWQDRLAEKGIEFEKPFERFGLNVLRFKDPDNLQLELVFDPQANDQPAWVDNSVPQEHGIRGFWSANLLVPEEKATAKILEEVLGFEKKSSEDNLNLYQSESEIGHSVIIETADEFIRGKIGRGSVHHVAFRTKDEEESMQKREQLIKMGLQPTGIIDRDVFKSIYFQTPGGVLFELATDGPGYASVVDNEKEMGKELFLPPWFEKQRDTIEQMLPEIKV